MAILVHEYGHHRGGSVRAGAMLVPLMYPWIATRALLGHMRRNVVAASMYIQGFATFFLVRVGIVTVSLLHQRPLVGIGITVAVLVAAVVLPAVAAKGKRVEELHADDVAARLGYGTFLGLYLQWWSEYEINTATAGPWARLMASHPPASVRAARLLDLTQG